MDQANLHFEICFFIFRPEPSLAIGAVAISSDSAKDSNSAWLIPLVICFVISLCILATAMLFYVKCHGAPNRAPKTSLIDMTRTTRAQFLPSFAKNGNPVKLQANSAQNKMRLNNLDIDLNSTQSRCQFGAKNAFPKAELQLLPTSSESNFAGSSDIRNSALDQTECLGQMEDAKRLSHRYKQCNERCIQYIRNTMLFCSIRISKPSIFIS